MTTYLLDTNAYIRFLIKDNISQAKEVSDLIKKVKFAGDRIHLPVFIILEIIFVLEKFNKSPREKIVSGLKKLFALNIFDVEDRVSLIKCLDIFMNKRSLSIVDILLMNMAKDQNFSLFTFDKKLQLAMKNFNKEV